MDEISVTLKADELKKAFRIMLSGSEMDSLAEIGRKIGFKETTFRTAVNKNTLRYSDFIKAAEILGYRVMIHKDTDN